MSDRVNPLRGSGFSFSQPAPRTASTHIATTLATVQMQKYMASAAKLTKEIADLDEDLASSHGLGLTWQRKQRVTAVGHNGAMMKPEGWGSLGLTVEQALRSQKVPGHLVLPPQPPKSDSPPPGVVMKAVRESAKRSSMERLRPQRQSSIPPPLKEFVAAQGPQERPASQDHNSPKGGRRQLSSASSSRSMAGTRSKQTGKDDQSQRPPPRSPGRPVRMGSGSRPNSRPAATDYSPAARSVGAGARREREAVSDRLHHGESSPSSSSHLRRRKLEASEDAVVGPAAEPGSPKQALGPVCGWAACLASVPGRARKEPKREIQLLRSAFVGRPPVLLFDYEPESGAPPKNMSRLLTDEELKEEGFEHGLPKMFYAHEKTKDCHEYNAVLNTLKQCGLHRTTTTSSKWSLHWGSHPTPEMLRGFHRFQKANHFPASWQLGRKDLLWRNVYRLKRQFPQQFNIMPASFVMPDDFASWTSAREQSPGAIWIYKPASLSCGKGIKLYTSVPNLVSDKKLAQKSGVIQRYLDRPMMINGYKFDLRLYVVVTSFDPLKVYLNAEGLVRLATERYERPNVDNLNHRTMHLTNYSVNKHSENYVKNEDFSKGGAATGGDSGEEDAAEGERLTSDAKAGNAAEAEEQEEADEDANGAEDDDASPSSPMHNRSDMPSSKWSFGQLRSYFEEIGQDYDEMMTHIKDLIVKTLMAVDSPIVNTWHQGANYTTSGVAATQLGPNQTCFELYGFDVMLDDKLKPWLLEVNTFPSISSSSPFDKRVKTMLVADALTCAGFLPFDHEVVEQAIKDEKVERLQGLHQKHKSVVAARSHTMSSINTATLKDIGEAEWQLIVDAHDEFLRRGQLERIYPTREGVERYAPLFVTPRYSNLVLSRWLQAGGERCFTPEGRSEIPQWVPRLISDNAC